MCFYSRLAFCLFIDSALKTTRRTMGELMVNRERGLATVGSRNLSCCAALWWRRILPNYGNVLGCQGGI